MVKKAQFRISRKAVTVAVVVGAIACVIVGINLAISAFRADSLRQAHDLLLSEMDQDKRTGLNTLLYFGPDERGKCLAVRLLADPNPRVRLDALEILDAYGMPSDSVYVAPLLEDDDRLVRREAEKVIRELEAMSE